MLAKYAEKIVMLPRYEGTVYHRSTRRLLIEARTNKGVMQLIWVHPSQYQICGVRHQNPAKLVLRKVGDQVVGETIHEGGRLSRRLIDTLRPHLVAQLGDWGSLDPLHATILMTEA